MHKISVHALHEMPDGTMRWEEVDTLGEYSVFVDCAGRSAIACADAAGWRCRRQLHLLHRDDVLPWRLAALLEVAQAVVPPVIGARRRRSKRRGGGKEDKKMNMTYRVIGKITYGKCRFTEFVGLLML